MYRDLECIRVYLGPHALHDDHGERIAEEELHKLVAMETYDMVNQIQILKQQLENKQKDLKVSTKKLHKHLKGDGSPAVTPEQKND